MNWRWCGVFFLTAEGAEDVEGIVDFGVIFKRRGAEDAEGIGDCGVF